MKLKRHFAWSSGNWENIDDLWSNIHLQTQMLLKSFPYYFLKFKNDLMEYIFNPLFNPILLGRDNFVLHPKFIPKSSIRVKLHKMLSDMWCIFICIFLIFFSKTTFINNLRDLPMTSLWNSLSTPRSNSHKIKSVALSKTDL